MGRRSAAVVMMNDVTSLFLLDSADVGLGARSIVSSPSLMTMTHVLLKISPARSICSISYISQELRQICSLGGRATFEIRPLECSATLSLSRICRISICLENVGIPQLSLILSDLITSFHLPLEIGMRPPLTAEFSKHTALRILRYTARNCSATGPPTTDLIPTRLSTSMLGRPVHLESSTL
jgi:hypothetical protein